jgi:hypothetical protein
MTELVLKSRSTLYFKHQPKWTRYHLTAKNPSPRFEFPSREEINGLWKRVTDAEENLMFYGNHEHLVLSVPTKLMQKFKQPFLSGLKQLVAAKEDTHV